MKILVVCPRFDETSGGDGLYAYRLAQECAVQGNEIQVFTIRENSFVRLILGQSDGRIQSSSDLGQVQRDVIGKNFFSTSARRSLSQLLGGFDPDVVHVHGIHQYFTVSCLPLLKRAGVPIIITVHDYKWWCGNAGFFSDRRNEPCTRCITGKVLPPVTERCKNGSRIRSIAAAAQMATWRFGGLMEGVAAVHAPSRFVEGLLKPHMRGGKIVCIRLPALVSAGIGERIGLHTPPSVIFVGRMVPHKGAAIFAEAVRTVNAPIHFFGDGPELRISKELLRERHDVVFHGWTSRETIHQYLGPGSIVVLPYLAYETFCFAVFEAMLQGSCVVSSSRGAIPELIRHNENGILVDPPTPEGFRREIEALLGSPEKMTQLSTNAASIESELDILSIHTQKITKLYGEVALKKN